MRSHAAFLFATSPKAALLLACTILITGCFGGSYVPIARYAIDPAIQVEPATPVEKSIGIRPLSVARPYRLEMVFRETPLKLEFRPNAEWAEEPRYVLTRAIVDALDATGAFSDVGNAGDIRLPGYVLTGELRRFDELRTENPWVAECEVRIEVRSVQDSHALWHGNLVVREPLDENDAAHFAAAMSRVVAQLAQDIAQRTAETALEHVRQLKAEERF